MIRGAGGVRGGGGMWKNSEDEVLKAGVMKYGLNNWSRVASLLVRKSAKQCKARWFEWLDPSVKKLDWSRAEEEKLLHLAKLFPNQWRTIAPIVGRTAYQCLEKYERLLDAVAGGAGGSGAGAAGGGGAAGNGRAAGSAAAGFAVDGGLDLRTLAPGEIDPHPETYPAKPDPIDLPDDEREMLAEARARLSNTRGKKAKRKAREKMLEDARRVAVLQKSRELAVAGIGPRRQKRRRDGVEYLDKEIPFETRAPAGRFAPDPLPEASAAASSAAANRSLEEIEGLSRREEERRLRKADSRKLKKLMQDDLPQALDIIEKMNQPASAAASLATARLTLPAPQLRDEDLEEILRTNTYAGDSATAKTDVPQSLAQGGSRSRLAHATPTGGPGTHATGLGTPAVVPDSLKTPLAAQRRKMRNAARRTPAPAPDREAFREPAERPSGDTSGAAASLELPPASLEGACGPVDAEEAEAEAAERAQEARRREVAMRSQVVQRGLPRPVLLTHLLEERSAGAEEPAAAPAGDTAAFVEREIEREMGRLVLSDAVSFPLPLKQLRLPPPDQVPRCEPVDLSAAVALVEEELERSADPAVLAELEAQLCAGTHAARDDPEEQAALEKRAAAQCARLTRRVEKARARVAALVEGHERRAAELQLKIAAQHRLYLKLQIDLEQYAELERVEKKVIERRIRAAAPPGAAIGPLVPVAR